LLDRFDLRVAVDRPEVDDLLQIGGGESTAAVAVRVAAARQVAHDRAGVSNARLTGELLDRTAVLSAPAKELLRQELEANRLTGRGYHRLRRVARTVADLMGDVEPVVHEHHVAMAMQLRVRLGSAVRGRAA
jgi:magnesium chelatase family protein